MWPAQGLYYSINAKFYAMETDVSIEQCNLNFAAYFASIYLGAEGTGKCFITLMYLIFRTGDWQVYSFIVYTVLAFTSTATCGTISDLGVKGVKLEGENDNTGINGTAGTGVSTGASTYVSTGDGMSTSGSILCTGCIFSLWALVLEEISAVFAVVWEHPVFFSLLPYQILFGFSSSYVNYYVFGIVMGDNGKEGYIGLVSAMAVVIASVIALPLASLINNSYTAIAKAESEAEGGNRNDSNSNSGIDSISKRGANAKLFVMLFGVFCFGACSSVLLFTSDDEKMSHWSIVIPLVSLYGAGRGIWENTNKAIIANMFEYNDEDRGSAFSALYFFSGTGGAIGFFAYQYMSPFQIGLLNVIIAALSFVGNYYCCMYE
jgi:hypothetical protein